ncbi:MAG: MFS transporter [Herbiconiux sp.]|uniref:MFS transporter n=1 Tax=Herbiconiux sp. TaxID=1871186 RepID=UPI0012257990|nr:MFS transporter [Herbiconiux sp.]TAJ48001.1 MAG: MFS transporter [Herbiconiux sp.]
MILTAAQAERRLLILTTTRWLPVGLTFGLTLLLPLERGITLVQLGVLLSVQGFVVLGLELPTGGLADSIGRRPLLVASGVLAVLSTVLFVVADMFWMFAIAMVLQGVFRALDSGPLEAWYVDTAQASDPHVPIDRALSRAATVLGGAIAVGALLGGALVAWHPIAAVSALVPPFVMAAVLSAGHTLLTALLVRESGATDTGKPNGDASDSRRAAARIEVILHAARGTVGRAVRGAPAAVVEGVRVVGGSRVLRALVLVEVFWSIAMIAFETLTPIRLAELVGGEDAAGALFGPMSAVAWAVFAAGSAVAGFASRWIGVAWTAIVARVLNGAFVVLMGVAAGLPGLVAGYWLAYATHGAAGPMHSTLLHRQAVAANRATVLSVNSMVAGGAYSLGLLALTPLAEATTPATAMIAAGTFSILGALLYLPALRAERHTSY